VSGFFGVIVNGTFRLRVELFILHCHDENFQRKRKAGEGFLALFFHWQGAPVKKQNTEF